MCEARDCEIDGDWLIETGSMSVSLCDTHKAMVERYLKTNLFV